ncbi:MAG: 50S ribosomal protein L15, partial [Candidatus Cloacimonadota bacterium]
GGQMPLQRRVPKRGFTNIFKKQYRIVNLKQLLAFEDEEFDIEKFEALNLIRKAKAREKAPVKVLAKGAEEFNKKVKIKANAFSKTAKEIIEKNGGSVEVI